MCVEGKPCNCDNCSCESNSAKESTMRFDAKQLSKDLFNPMIQTADNIYKSIEYIDRIGASHDSTKMGILMFKVACNAICKEIDAYLVDESLPSDANPIEFIRAAANSIDKIRDIDIKKIRGEKKKNIHRWEIRNAFDIQCTMGSIMNKLSNMLSD
jgi:hypothetical protein